MQLQLESTHLEDYLREIPPVIAFNTPLVQEKIHAIKAQARSPEERARLAFLVARDEVHHSFDTKNATVTINAEDALAQHEGICFAKSHVLAALLRGMEIPAGFCYQRVLRKGTVESGYALHGLNAVYLPDVGWFRLDPRGNKPGVDAQFSTTEERLAYPIREALGEVDYPNVFTEPLSAVIESMVDSKDSFELFFKRPESL
ncbi:MAG: transglutaminase family protein [Flavobacteriales bacterium]